MSTATLSSIADPWAWSLESVLALSGVIVGGIGAVATVLVAVMALKATNRANRLEAESRERAGRVALSAAVEAFLGGWEPKTVLHRSIEDVDAENALGAAAAGVSQDAQAVAQWVIDATQAAVYQTQNEHKQDDRAHAEAMMALTGVGVPLVVRRRVTAWVATGVLDRSPLLAPTPGPPDLDAIAGSAE